MTLNVQTADYIYISLINSMGKMAKTNSYQFETKESRKVEFNLDQVSNGSYFLRAKTTNSILIEGVIVNK